MIHLALHYNPQYYESFLQLVGFVIVFFLQIILTYPVCVLNYNCLPCILLFETSVYRVPWRISAFLSEQGTEPNLRQTSLSYRAEVSKAQRLKYSDCGFKDLNQGFGGKINTTASITSVQFSEVLLSYLQVGLLSAEKQRKNNHSFFAGLGIPTQQSFSLPISFFFSCKLLLFLTCKCSVWFSFLA